MDYSPAFNALVIKETVDRNSFGINAGYDFTKALFCDYGIHLYPMKVGTSVRWTIIPFSWDWGIGSERFPSRRTEKIR